MYQIIRDFIVLIWHGRQSTENLQLQQAQAATQQAKVAMEMSLELVVEYRQRLETLELQMAEYRHEMDVLKEDHYKANGTISELQRQLKENQRQLKEYQVKLREYERKSNADEQTIKELRTQYESTIATLRQRIEELEAKSDA